MTDEQFSRAFKAAAATDAGSAGAIVAGARKKRRRGRVAAGALVAAVLVAVATPLALQWTTGDQDLVLATPAPTSQNTTPTAETSPDATPTLPSEDTGGLTSQVCEDVQAGRLAPDTLPHGQDLPTGAARVWLCGDLIDPFGGAVGPREPLLTEPDRVVAAINALERPAGMDTTTACTAVGGLTFRVVVDYPDGQREVIEAETMNCGWVGGWGQRTGGGQLLGEILPMWEEQRKTLPPYEGKPALCEGFPRSLEDTAVIAQVSFLQVTPADLTRGVVCGLDSEAPNLDGGIIQRWLSPKVVQRIADGELSPAGLNPGVPYLVMLTAHGDPFLIQLTTEQAAAPWLAETMAGIRTEPFFLPSPHCSAYDPEGNEADLAEVTSGVVCLDEFAVPDKPVELAPELVAQIATGFDAEAAPPTYDYGGMVSNQGVTLLDETGRFIHLQLTVDRTGLIAEHSSRYWEVPDGIREQLIAHGLELNPPS